MACVEGATGRAFLVAWLRLAQFRACACDLALALLQCGFCPSGAGGAQAEWNACVRQRLATLLKQMGKYTAAFEGIAECEPADDAALIASDASAPKWSEFKTLTDSSAAFCAEASAHTFGVWQSMHVSLRDRLVSCYKKVERAGEWKATMLQHPSSATLRALLYQQDRLIEWRAHAARCSLVALPHVLSEPSLPRLQGSPPLPS